MISVVTADSRGLTQVDWLHSAHSFSFGSYRDPARMGVGPLRVINEDRVTPGGGFATHGHADMEILSYVIAGALSHRDSTGVSSVILPGELQRMRAGTGIRHSEFNHSQTEPVHFLQIWILPNRKGLTPGYAQQAFPLDARADEPVLLASLDGDEGSVEVSQDIRLYGSRLREGKLVRVALDHGRLGFVQVVAGSPMVNGRTCRAGDGLLLDGESQVEVSGNGAEVLIFDLPRRP
jgi:hypothetical protein